MSALSDLLNRHFEMKYGDLSNRRIAERAGISRGTIDNYRKGTHPARPSDEVLSAFHELLGIPMSRLRDAAGLPTGEEEPYTPPREANLLDHRQRRALDELIRSIVAAKEARDEDPSTQDPQGDPTTHGEAGPSGAPMKNADVAWLDDRRAPDVDEMLEKVAAEAARQDEAGEPLPFEPADLHAARGAGTHPDLRGPSKGERLHQQIEEAGEESQDHPYND